MMLVIPKISVFKFWKVKILINSLWLKKMTLELPQLPVLIRAYECKLAAHNLYFHFLSPRFFLHFLPLWKKTKIGKN